MSQMNQSLNNHSDNGSSKQIDSMKDDILSGRAIFKIQVSSWGKAINPANTLTEGFFRHQNFIFSPNNREMLSVRSKKEINQNINTNSKIYNIEGGKKSMKVNDKVVKRLKLKPTCDTPKFQDFKHSTLTQNHNIYGGKHVRFSISSSFSFIKYF